MPLMRGFPEPYEVILTVEEYRSYVVVAYDADEARATVQAEWESLEYEVIDGAANPQIVEVIAQ